MICDKNCRYERSFGVTFVDHFKESRMIQRTFRTQNENFLFGDFYEDLKLEIFQVSIHKILFELY